ncbi:MAG: tetratricopeptide repeat protein, partial [Muribaculaceae bacterium]|nr:tetratricopeptide repeat protein [Muribaculaceae bacterium]
LYNLTGNRSEAYVAFKKAGSGPSTPYRTKFNARIRQSEVYAGTNISKEVSALRNMTRFERNKEFLDQIYYAIGNLYLSRSDTARAKENYILAVEKSTRDGVDKALANLALGRIWFAEGNYVKAQPCYSGALPLLPENFPDYKSIRQRSDVLDQLAVYAGNVQLQDSLLTLSRLSPEEQRQVAQKIVDDLIRREKLQQEAAARDEYLAAQEGNRPNTPQNSAAAPAFSMNTDKSWYFYNTMTKNAGKTEFQRRWGARKLEDDWRRRNKTSFSFGDADEEEIPADSIVPEDTAPADSIPPGSDDPHNPEFYLRQIPSTPEEIAVANEVIVDGLYNMGVILKDNLEDYAAARREFMRLLDRYPDNIYRLDVYYNLYLMAMRQENPSLAEKWRDLILADFPDTPYGRAMADPDYFDNLRRMHQVQEQLYAEAYEAYLDNDNS